MRVGNKQTLDDGPLHQFVLCDDTLKCVNVVNDLGVLVDPYLIFEAHIDNIVQKAARRCYLIFKPFQSRNTELLVRAFYRATLCVSAVFAVAQCPSVRPFVCHVGALYPYG